MDLNKKSRHMRVSNDFYKIVKDMQKSLGKQAVQITKELANELRNRKKRSEVIF